MDNCSRTDLIEKLREKYSGNRRVNIIRSEKNGGYGYGHNFGIRNLPESDYHLVLNPDVIIHKSTIDEMVDFMNSNPMIGMLSPRILNTDGSLQALNKREPTILDLFLRRFVPIRFQNSGMIKHRLDKYTMMDVGYENTTEVQFMSGCFMMIRRSLIDSGIFFDDRYFMYFEDADLSRQMAEISKVVYYPEVSITHHLGRFAHKKFKFMLIFIKSAFLYFNKWGWRIF
ncbi:MAG: glycosyltransferase [Spirochaetia bacterium]|nr:glycosyltransferase [Spirochaetia bacterium]